MDYGLRSDRVCCSSTVRAIEKHWRLNHYFIIIIFIILGFIVFTRSISLKERGGGVSRGLAAGLSEWGVNVVVMCCFLFEFNKIYNHFLKVKLKQEVQLLFKSAVCRIFQPPLVVLLTL